MHLSGQIVSSGSAPMPCAGTLAQVLDASIQAHANRLAVLAPGRPPLTYAKLGRQLDAVARTLADAGYGRRSRLAIALPEGPEFAVAVLAVCRTAVCAPLNPRLEQQTLATLLRAMRIDALVVANGEDSSAVRAAREAGADLVRLNAAPCSDAGSFTLLAEHPRASVALELPAPEDIAFLGHTSGTTGMPKIVPYEQFRAVEAALNRAASGQLGETDRILLLTPLYSLGGIRRTLLPPLLVGGSIICPVSHDAKALVDLLQELSPTEFMASPAMQMALLDEFGRHGSRARHALRRIYSTFSELPEQVRDRLETVFGVPIILTYGMTEAGNIAQTAFPPERAPPGSVGRAVKKEVAVVDAAGHIARLDAEGEILVRGPEVFNGYENDAESTRKAFLDGWFRTGDLGRIDRDGFVFLIGRVKDIINRGGDKIAPSEVESVLMQHPAVRDAAVFSLPHATLGEDIAAAIVVSDEHWTSESELRRHLRQRLTPFKVPARIIVMEALPRNQLGKVDRAALAKGVEEQTPPDMEAPQGEWEIRVARIFSAVLAESHIGRQDNFFDLGGDSLRGVRVLASVEEAFGLAVPLELLFDNPTVVAFAEEISALARRRDEITESSDR